jgi:hypothetical protein
VSISFRGRNEAIARHDTAVRATRGEGLFSPSRTCKSAYNTFSQGISAKLSTDLSLGHNIEHHPTRSTGGRENKKGDALTTPTFQKHDRVAFRDSPEVQGEIVELWKGDFYKVAWDSGITYQGKTTIVSANVIRKKES